MTLEHPNFVIVDDFLDEDTWSNLWTELQFMELLPVTRTRGAWKLDDGVPLGGAEVVTEPLEPGTRNHQGLTAVDALITALCNESESWSELVGEAWERISARPYVYPRETGLSWHVDDHALYAGAFIYYAHPRWNAHWGGELLIAETEPDSAPDGSEEPAEAPIMGYRFDNEGFSERIAAVGCGNFVLPKPNRLVVLSGAPHMIARVSPATGQHVRASVAGFFLRPEA